MKQKISYNAISNVIIYLVVLMTIFINSSMITRDVRYNLPATLLYILLFGGCIIQTIIQLLRGGTAAKKIYVEIFVICVVVILTAISVTGNGVANGIVFIVVPMILFLLLFSNYDDMQCYWIAFSNIMVIVAIVSLLFYFLGSVFNIIKPSGIATFLYDGTYRTCKTYYGIQYEAQTAQTVTILGRYRNCSFFIEAPMYCAMLLYALFSEIAFRTEIRKFNVIVLTVAIVTTLTTTGIIVIVALIIVRILTADSITRNSYIKIIAIPGLFLIGILVFEYVLQFKLSSSAGIGSYNVRLDHMIACLKMWLRRPFFGYGYDADDVFYGFTRYRQGMSIGLLDFLARFGVLSFFLYIIPWGVCVYITVKRKDKRIYYLVGSFITLFMTAIAERPIMLATIGTQVAMLVKFQTLKKEQ